MILQDAKYLAWVLKDHGYKPEGMPRAIVILDGEHEDLLARNPDLERGPDNAVIVDGVSFVPLKAVEDRIPHRVYTLASNGNPAMWW